MTGVEGESTTDVRIGGIRGESGNSDSRVKRTLETRERFRNLSKLIEYSMWNLGSMGSIIYGNLGSRCAVQLVETRIRERDPC